MIERGNTKHGPELDEQLAHEAQSIVQGHGSNAHVEEFRQSEPVPDDSDSDETVEASGYDGPLEGRLLSEATDVTGPDGMVLGGDYPVENGDLAYSTESEEFQPELGDRATVETGDSADADETRGQP